MAGTSINAELILASKNALTGDVLYTFVLTFPRMILAEVNTHRVVSRNTASSRAIPSRKYRKAVLEDPFIPGHIGANQKGMQAGEELSGWRRRAVEAIWSAARYPQVGATWAMEKLGAHKQIANRLLEPWVWTQQIFSATELDNFFRLRDHHMAEPHFQELAQQMRWEKGFADIMLSWLGDGQRTETAQVLSPGQWHLPFIDADEWFVDLEIAKKVSAARCARVSYNLPETGQRSTLHRDLELFERLAVRELGSDDPVHLSPLEHQATPLPESVFCGNFKGFKQHRKEVLGEAGKLTMD